MRRFAGAIFLVLSALACRAEKDLPQPEFSEESGYEMKLTAAYESIPPMGFYPVRVKMTNPSASTRQWQFRSLHRLASQETISSASNLEVPPGATRTFELLIPLAAETSSSPRYSSLDFNITGPGVTQGNSFTSDSGTGKTPTAFIGMGETLSVPNWGPLQSLLEKTHSRGIQGTPLDMNFMPTSWRALAGFQLIVLTGGEWRGLSTECRDALSDWVFQGGGLILAGEPEATSADLPPAGPTGMGMVEHWPDLESFTAKIANKLSAFPDLATARGFPTYDSDWPLARELGGIDSPGILILCFVVVFAVVIGPVNFLVFAPAGRRHRLFWTTPALSLLASFLMGAYILLQEGIGGSGMRFTAQLSLPASHKLLTWQEQISRTGVLTGVDFRLPDTTIPTPLSLGERDGFRNRQISFSYDGGVWGGEWFKSRSTQAQLLNDVSTNRERLEVSIAEDGTLSITSGFSRPLTEIWYIDDSGKVWQGKGARPGETLPLAKARMAEFQRWKAAALKQASPAMREMVDANYGVARGRFFATQDGISAINSLPSIRWKDAGGILFGEALKKP